MFVYLYNFYYLYLRIQQSFTKRVFYGRCTDHRSGLSVGVQYEIIKTFHSTHMAQCLEYNQCSTTTNVSSREIEWSDNGSRLPSSLLPRTTTSQRINRMPLNNKDVSYKMNRQPISYEFYYFHINVITDWCSFN